MIRMAPTFADSSGHDLFVFKSLSQKGADISNFHPASDALDLAPLLKSIGYTGQDPIADHLLSLKLSGVDSTAVLIDPTGGHHADTLLVTLDHVLPQNLHAQNIWH